MKKPLGLFRRGHRPDAEALSAFADGLLAPADATRLGQHVTGCAACARELEDLNRVRAMLSSMGRVEVPRSFRLRQSQVESLAKAPARGAGAFPGRALAFAPAVSMAAVVLFAAVLAADLGTRGDGGDGDMFAASRQLESENLSMTEDAAADSARADDGGAEAGGAAAPEAGAATTISPDESQVAQADDTYYADTPASGLAPAPSVGETASSDADEAEALNATSEDDDGVRASYLAAEIALAALAIGAIAWIIYARTRTKEDVS